MVSYTFQNLGYRNEIYLSAGIKFTSTSLSGSYVEISIGSKLISSGKSCISQQQALCSPKVTQCLVNFDATSLMNSTQGGSLTVVARFIKGNSGLPCAYSVDAYQSKQVSMVMDYTISGRPVPTAMPSSIPTIAPNIVIVPSSTFLSTSTIAIITSVVIFVFIVLSVITYYLYVKWSHASRLRFKALSKLPIHRAIVKNRPSAQILSLIEMNASSISTLDFDGYYNCFYCDVLIRM